MLDLIDWAPPERELGPIYWAAGGAGLATTALFKALLLAVWYDLPDVKLADALDDCASLRRFCGFSAEEMTPERMALVRLRRQLVARGLDTALLGKVTPQLKSRAMTVETGTLIGATVIASANHPNSEAAWGGQQRRKAIPGFKAHVGADADTAIVEKLVVTRGDLDDGRAGGGASPDEPGDVHADGAYGGQTFATAIRAKGGSFAHRADRHVGQPGDDPLQKAQELEP